MSILSDVGEADVRAPFFDPPRDAGEAQLLIGMGTTVVLALQGSELSAQVTAIERLGTVFVGRVLKVMPGDARPDDVAPDDVAPDDVAPDDVAPDDLVRFRLRDVHRIE